MTDQADTPDPIGEWLAAGEKATGTHWITKKDAWVIALDADGAPAVGECFVGFDAEFIAASRNVVPAVRALAAELAAARDREAERVATVLRDWLHTTPLSRCGMSADTCLDWPLAHELAAVVLAALSQSEPTKERSE